MPPASAAILQQRVHVTFEYPVVFTRDTFDPANATLPTLLGPARGRRHRVLPVIDAGVARAFPELAPAIGRFAAAHATSLELAADPIVVTGGEDAKRDNHVVERVLAQLAALRMDRHAYVLAVGGGAVLDAVGYATAIAHRGLRLIRVPTTVLAQNDAGIGVKNGINGYGAKNFLGTFAPPFAVINDSAFLTRLPARERIAGTAEAIKVALIRDANLFAWIEAQALALRDGNTAAIETLIRRCAELHLDHIARGGDPFERGSARPLDFGHWAAHRLETATAHELRHGEAVAIGMRIDCRYAARIGLLAPRDEARIAATLTGLGLPVFHPALAAHAADGRLDILNGLDEFREHLGGDLSITLLRAVGESVEVHAIDRAAMTDAILSLGASA